MTTSEVKVMLRAYLLNKVDVPVFIDNFPPDIKTERVVVNCLKLNGKSWQEGYANINYYVPDDGEPNGARLKEVETQLFYLFNHGTLIDKMYLTIDNIDQIKDNFSHYINLRLHLQISNHGKKNYNSRA